MRPTRDGTGTGIATYAGWERETLGSIWNGNYKQRVVGLGNDGVYTEWERERNGNGNLNGIGNGSHSVFFGMGMRMGIGGINAAWEQKYKTRGHAIWDSWRSHGSAIGRHISVSRRAK